jgi:hypothetical protein
MVLKNIYKLSELKYKALHLLIGDILKNRMNISQLKNIGGSKTPVE